MRIFLIILIIVITSACAPRLSSPPAPTQAPIDKVVQLIPTGTSIVETGQIVTLAIADLSTRLNLDPAEVHVLSIDSQLWPNSALGCPRPGKTHPQQTVSGYRLILEANNLEYIYHTDADRTVILCLEEDLPSFPVTPGEIDDGEPWMPVD